MPDEHFGYTNTLINIFIEAMEQMPKRDIENVVYPACLSPESLAMNKFYFGRSSGSFSVQHLPIPSARNSGMEIEQFSFQFPVYSFQLCRSKIHYEFQIEELETVNFKLETKKELTATGIAPDLHRTSLLMIAR